MTQSDDSAGVSYEGAITDEFDVDEHDDLRQELFDHVQDLRKRGHTPKEIVPRLRDIADALEDHFGDSDSWDQCPAERDYTLVGDDRD